MTRDSLSPVRASYDAWAATYDSDRNRTRDLDRAVTREVLDGLAVRSAIEIGCGTGKNTAFLARGAERVLALDFSPGMLGIARDKLGTETGLRSETAPRARSGSRRVAFAVADATAGWPCRDGWADLVTCNLVLEHVPALAPVFAEACRTLAPGGWFFVSELHPERQVRGTRARFEQAGITTEIEAFVHPVEEFLEAAEAAGLSIVRRDDWWHEEDTGKPPRVISFLFSR